jgi:putative Mn2+ efflux pump MntP
LSLAAVLGIAFALAMDAFAVSIGLSAGLQRLSWIQSLRLAFFFGLFQFGMPLLGWTAGRSILPLIQEVDHWVAAGLLFLVGWRMTREAFRPGSGPGERPVDPTRGLSLVVLSVATSIDALAVGLSLALLQAAILLPCVIIGMVAMGMTLLGTRVGPLLGRLAGRRAELIGALVLFLIGVKILFDHL